jgi:hypothetical protein
MNLTRVIGAMVVVAALAVVAAAQKTVTTMGDMVKTTATIQAIDSTARLITFKNPDGSEDTVVAGPEFMRFNELKVGDRVNLHYYESRVYQLRKPGDPPINLKSADAITRSNGALPGATVASQTVTTVTVKSIDPAVPSITVTTKDGRTVTRKVDDTANLAGVHPGDQIDIVYTEALLASVEREK